MDALEFLDPKILLLNVAQKDVFEVYMNIKVDFNKKYLNTLRSPEEGIDKHPSCTFYLDRGVLKFKDWALDKIYTCLDVIKIVEQVDIYKAIDIATTRFVSIADVISTRGMEDRTYSIRIVEDVFDDYSYFKRYKISKQVLRGIFNIIPVECVKINEKIYSKKDYGLIYAIFLASNSVKLYFPLMERDRRFRSYTNNKSQLFGVSIVGRCRRVLFITSSAKDAACIVESGFDCVAPQAESTPIQSHIAEFLCRYYKTVIILYDNDPAGRRYSTILKNMYPKMYKAIWPKVPYKDISDWRKADWKKSEKFLKKLIKKANEINYRNS